MSSCLNCNKREVGCHSKCADYLADKLFTPSKPKNNNYGASGMAQMGCVTSRFTSSQKRTRTTKQWLQGQNISYREYIRTDVVVNCL